MGYSTGMYNRGALAGTYDMIEIEANTYGVTGKCAGEDNPCPQVSGRFAMEAR